MRNRPLTEGPWKTHHLYPDALVSQADPFTSLLTVADDGTALFLSKEDCRLAAAAPDLLEALKAVVSVADRATAEFDKARAAIAKATGAA